MYSYRTKITGSESTNMIVTVILSSQPQRSMPESAGNRDREDRSQ